MLNSLMIIILSVGSKSLTGVSPGNLRLEQILALLVNRHSLLDALLNEEDDVFRLTIDIIELKSELRPLSKFFI